jgi:hypothetical protein
MIPKQDYTHVSPRSSINITKTWLELVVRAVTLVVLLTLGTIGAAGQITQGSLLSTRGTGLRWTLVFLRSLMQF